MEKRTAAEKKAAKTAALETAKHEAKKLKNEEKKATAIAKIQLPNPPAEIIVDIETTKPREEKAMETTITPVKPTRTQLVSVIAEMNKILVDCKIPTANSYTNEILTNMILAKELELTSADFILATDDTRSVDSIFTVESTEVMKSLGITIPQPAAVKTAKSKKEKVSDKFTRHDAVFQALDSMSADGLTFAELQTEIDNIMVARGHASVKANSCDQIVRFTLETLIHYDKVTKDSESKKYTFKNVISENA